MHDGMIDLADSSVCADAVLIGGGTFDANGQAIGAVPHLPPRTTEVTLRVSNAQGSNGVASYASVESSTGAAPMLESISTAASVRIQHFAEQYGDKRSPSAPATACGRCCSRGLV